MGNLRGKRKSLCALYCWTWESTRVFRRHGVTCTATENDVDVLIAAYAFRLKILHERGLNLLNKEAENDKAKRVHSTDKKLSLHSQHATMINGLQGRHPN
ncbi:hypothetical protein HN51_034740 [Arachis hypogaea]